MTQPATPSPVQVFLARLEKAGLDVDHVGFAEAIWLAEFLPATATSSVETRDSSAAAAPPSKPQDVTGVGDVKAAPQAESGEGSVETKPPEEEPPASTKEAGLYAKHRGLAGGKTIPASPVSVVAGSALPSPLLISRGIRALRRRRDSSHEAILDEQETVEATAQSERLTLVLRPLQERWFDLALVIEDSPSMVIWRKTLDEFQRLLERNGAFRDVRRWRLQATNGETPGLRLLSDSGRETGPRALADPSGRRLILVATQGVTTLWSQRPVAEAMLQWGTQMPVAVLQMLPPRFWLNTKLGEPDCAIQPAVPGMPNAICPVWRTGPPVEQEHIPIPVVPLDENALRRWADTVMARGGSYSPAKTFVPSDLQVQEPGAKKEKPSKRELSVEQRVSRFMARASAPAWKLAVALSATPLVIPVMRLVQTAILGPAARHVQLAEILLSGLLMRVTPEEEQVDPEEILYDFLPGVRDHLQRYLAQTDALHVLEQLSDYIRQHPDQAGRFQALVPDAQGGEQLADWARPFAGISESYLREAGFEGEAMPVPAPVLIDPTPADRRLKVCVIPYADDEHIEFAQTLTAVMARRGHSVIPLEDIDRSACLLDVCSSGMPNSESLAAGHGTGYRRVSPRDCETSADFQRLCESLEAQFRNPGDLHQVPALPPDHLPRQFAAEPVQRLLNGRSICLVGAPGSGRSTLAAYVAKRPEIARYYSGGIYWDCQPADIPGRKLWVGSVRNSSSFELTGITTMMWVEESFTSVVEQLNVPPLDTPEIERYLGFFIKKPAAFAIAVVIAKFAHAGWPFLQQTAAIAQLCKPRPLFDALKEFENPEEIPLKAIDALLPHVREFMIHLRAGHPYAMPEPVWRHMLAASSSTEWDWTLLLKAGLCRLQDSKLSFTDRVGVRMSYIAEREEDHKLIVDAYRNLLDGRDWVDGPDDGYYMDRIIWHLTLAGLGVEARATALRFGWLARRLEQRGVKGPVEDLSFLASHRDAGSSVVLQHLKNLESIEQPSPRDLAEAITSQTFPPGIPPLEDLWRDARAYLEEFREDKPAHFIRVAGSGVHTLPLEQQLVAEAVGRALASEGYGLITGGWSGVDYVVAKSFAEERRRLGRAVDSALLAIVEWNRSPDYKEGRVHHLLNREYAESRLGEAAAVVIIGGMGGSREIFELGRRKGLPAIALPSTGGDAAQAYFEMPVPWRVFPEKPIRTAVEARETAAQLVGLLHDILREPQGSPVEEVSPATASGTLPAIPGWDWAVRAPSADRQRGYFIDLHILPDGRILVILLLVPGKSARTAEIAGAAYRRYQSLLAETPRPAHLLLSLNGWLIELNEPNRFAISVCALLDPRSGTLDLTNAGTPYPALIRADGSVVQQQASGVPLGLLADAQREDVSTHVQPGESLLLFSDLDTKSGETIGIERIAPILVKSSRESAQSVIDSLAQFDLDEDAILMVVRRLPEQPADDPLQIFIREVEEHAREAVKGPMLSDMLRATSKITDLRYTVGPVASEVIQASLMSPNYETRVAGYVLWLSSERRVADLSDERLSETLIGARRSLLPVWLLVKCLSELCGPPYAGDQINDRDTEHLNHLAFLLSEREDPPGARIVAAHLEGTLRRLRPLQLAREFSDTRSQEPPGHERRQKLINIAERMREELKGVDPDFVLPMLQEGHSGRRMLAYAAACSEPRPRYWFPILKCLERHESIPFCEHWGFMALSAVLPMLPLGMFTEALQRRLASFGSRNMSPDRSDLYQEVITGLEYSAKQRRSVLEGRTPRPESISAPDFRLLWALRLSPSAGLTWLAELLPRCEDLPMLRASVYLEKARLESQIGERERALESLQSASGLTDPREPSLNRQEDLKKMAGYLNISDPKEAPPISSEHGVWWVMRYMDLGAPEWPPGEMMESS